MILSWSNLFPYENLPSQGRKRADNPYIIYFKTIWHNIKVVRDIVLLLMVVCCHVAKCTLGTFGHAFDGLDDVLGWEFHSEFRGILRLIQNWTFWTPEFSSEFYFSDCKLCSRQFWTHFFRFGILSCHLFFQFHELENDSATFVSGKWHQILILNTPTLFAHTIANPLLTISTWYTQIYENLIDVSRYRYHCWSTNTGKNGLWWWRSCWFLIRLQSGIRDRATPCYWFRLGLSGHNPQHYWRWWW